jgi:hypothetical protein
MANNGHTAAKSNGSKGSQDKKEHAKEKIRKLIGPARYPMWNMMPQARKVAHDAGLSIAECRGLGIK